MKQFIIVLAAVLASPITALGQNKIIDKINAIKTQTDVYFWSQYAHPIADTAIVNGTKWMLDEINIGRSTPLTIEEIKPWVKNILMDRGSRYSAFVYIRKSDVPGMAGLSAPAVAPATTTPVTIAPASSTSASTTSASTTSASSAPVTVTPQPSVPTASVPTASRAFVPELFIQNILQQKDFYKVYDYLTGQKAQGNLLQFGPLKDVEDYSSLDLIVFDMQSKQVISVLSQATNGTTRTNLVTGASDSLDNYPEDMVLVIWYIK